MSLESIRIECSKWDISGSIEISDAIFDVRNPFADPVLVSHCEDCLEIIEDVWARIERQCKLKLGDVGWKFTPKDTVGDSVTNVRILFACEWKDEYEVMARGEGMIRENDLPVRVVGDWRNEDGGTDGYKPEKAWEGIFISGGVGHCRYNRGDYVGAVKSWMDDLFEIAIAEERTGKRLHKGWFYYNLYRAWLIIGNKEEAYRWLDFTKEEDRLSYGDKAETFPAAKAEEKMICAKCAEKGEKIEVAEDAEGYECPECGSRYYKMFGEEDV